MRLFDQPNQKTLNLIDSSAMSASKLFGAARKERIDDAKVAIRDTLNAVRNVITISAPEVKAIPGLGGNP